MATLTVTIPDAVLPRVRAALCKYGGVPDSNANAKDVIVQFVKMTVQQVELGDARAAIVPPDVSTLAS